MFFFTLNIINLFEVSSERKSSKRCGYAVFTMANSKNAPIKVRVIQSSELICLSTASRIKFFMQMYNYFEVKT